MQALPYSNREMRIGNTGFLQGPGQSSYQDRVHTRTGFTSGRGSNPDRVHIRTGFKSGQGSQQDWVRTRTGLILGKGS